MPNSKTLAGQHPLFSLLEPRTRRFLERVCAVYHFTFQEWRQIIEMARDLELWQGPTFEDVWMRVSESGPDSASPAKEKIFRAVRSEFQKLRSEKKKYEAAPLRFPKENPLRIETERSEKKIHGACPVASPKTVCCNLRTIDAVQNCAFHCSYCTIQTFYGDRAVFDAELGAKLKSIVLEPGRFYHFGTGQSSDSLVWGNRNGILDDLCAFARLNPQILLEFKTKSGNVRYFLENETPDNIVVSWSLNPEIIIENEEHGTAALTKRLEAARALADRGVKVAFHFHPMVYYETWREDYPALAGMLLELFHPNEVLFVSFGSVTFIKPVLQAIRKRRMPTRILQMEMVPDPHGKWTYPDELKIDMFRTMYAAFQSWQDEVFFYLCMEKALIWDGVFGWHYETNEIFEAAFGKATMGKIGVVR